MDMNGFFEAIENIAGRLFKEGCLYDNLSALLAAT